MGETVFTQLYWGLSKVARAWKTEPLSFGCRRLGWRGPLLPRHGGSDDHGSNDRDGLPSAPLGGIGTGTHGMAWHSAELWSSLELLEVGARRCMCHQKGENRFGELNKI